MLRRAEWLQEYLALPSKASAYHMMREGMIPGVVRISPSRIRVSEEVVRKHFERTDENSIGAAALEARATAVASSGLSRLRRK